VDTSHTGPGEELAGDVASHRLILLVLSVVQSRSDGELTGLAKRRVRLVPCDQFIKVCTRLLLDFLIIGVFGAIETRHYLKKNSSGRSIFVGRRLQTAFDNIGKGQIFSRTGGYKMAFLSTFPALLTLLNGAVEECFDDCLARAFGVAYLWPYITRAGVEFLCCVLV
jgi:hypothetical protein